MNITILWTTKIGHGGQLGIFPSPAWILDKRKKIEFYQILTQTPTTVFEKCIPLYRISYCDL
jgi:hypothetical protein